MCLPGKVQGDVIVFTFTFEDRCQALIFYAGKLFSDRQAEILHAFNFHDFITFAKISCGQKYVFYSSTVSRGMSTAPALISIDQCCL